MTQYWPPSSWSRGIAVLFIADDVNLHEVIVWFADLWIVPSFTQDFSNINGIAHINV